MASARRGALLHHFRRLPEQAQPTASDRALLERFAGERDAQAFAALMHRHGPLVLGVCRRVRGHEQDAEDASQATFLLLARQTPSIRKGSSVGSWLHRVHLNTHLPSRKYSSFPA
jgi:DNA-directed RNA polymerase specialized sigma24 family protein